MDESRYPGSAASDDMSGADAQDELAAPIKRTRITPRHSMVDQSDSTLKTTPYASLRQLAGLMRRPTTPHRQKSATVAPTSLKRTATTTPKAGMNLVSNTRQPLQSISGNRSNPTTPHTMKALQQRRGTTGFARKSGRFQRETPRDILRNLSRVLAQPNHAPRPSRLSSAPGYDGPAILEDTAGEDELSPEQPRLSIPIGTTGDDDDDSFDAAPPRLSMAIEDTAHTLQSVEFARKEVVRQKSPRGSFGVARVSDHSPRVMKDDLNQRVALQYPDLEVDELSGSIDMDDYGGDTENLRKIFLTRSLGLEEQSAENEPQQRHNSFSPFALQIPTYEPRKSGDGLIVSDDLIDEDPLSLAGEAPICDEVSNDNPLFQHDVFSLVKTEKAALRRSRKLRKPVSPKLSRHGIPYKSFPYSIAKSVATTFARSSTGRRCRLSKETMSAIMEAGDLFLIQLSDDLAVYAQHAGRKSIDDMDILVAMKRQRRLNTRATAFSLAEQTLTDELVHDLRLPKLTTPPQRRGQIRHSKGAGRGREQDNI